MVARPLFPAGEHALREFAAAEVLVCLDFDGTLAPGAGPPEDAAMRPLTLALLSEVARLYPCVVTSGRSHADLRSRLPRVPLRGLIGNHGLEPSPLAGRFEAQVRRWLPVLRLRLADVPGVDIEDRGSTLAVHYRQARHRTTALKAILAAVELIGPVRLLPGKMLMNVIPPVGSTLGTAVEQLLANLGCDRAICVGDSAMEEVFALGSPRVLGIRVGKRSRTQASFFLERQADIDVLLRKLLELRQPWMRARARRSSTR